MIGISTGAPTKLRGRADRADRFERAKPSFGSFESMGAQIYG